MNREWSDLNKDMQALIKKKDTFPEGKEILFKLRDELMETVDSFKGDIKRKDFDSMPFINADGYHSKNIAYSIWHIFRIEDIVAHTLINRDAQIFFSAGITKKEQDHLSSQQAMNWLRIRSLSLQDGLI